MIYAVFACANAVVVGINLGIVFGGGSYNPFATSLGIIACGALVGYQLAKLKQLLVAGQGALK